MLELYKQIFQGASALKMKKITFTWYTRPENMRILVLPVTLVKVGFFLLAFGLLVPGGGLAWLLFIQPEPAPARPAIQGLTSVPVGRTTEEPWRERSEPKLLATVASTTGRTTKEGRVSDSTSSRSSASDLTLQEVPSEESPMDDYASDEPSSELADAPVQRKPAKAPLDFAAYSSETDERGHLNIEVQIKNLSTRPVSGSVWAVAMFVSFDGSRIMVPSHALIQAENISAEQNQRFGLPFKAKALTVKTFVFEPPTDIDGVFRHVTIVAKVLGDVSGPLTSSPPEPIIRTFPVSDQQ